MSHAVVGDIRYILVNTTQDQSRVTDVFDVPFLYSRRASLKFREHVPLYLGALLVGEMRKPPWAGIQALSFHEKTTVVEWYVTDLFDWPLLPVWLL